MVIVGENMESTMGDSHIENSDVILGALQQGQMSLIPKLTGTKPIRVARFLAYGMRLGFCDARWVFEDVVVVALAVYESALLDNDL